MLLVQCSVDDMKIMDSFEQRGTGLRMFGTCGVVGRLMELRHCLALCLAQPFVYDRMT